MCEVLELFPEGGSRKLVMLALADYANSRGEAWPSLPSIARMVHLHRDNIRRVLQSLVDDGWLGVIHQGRGGNPRDTTRYQINLARLRGEALFDPQNPPRQRRGLKPEQASETPRAGAAQSPIIHQREIPQRDTTGRGCRRSRRKARAESIRGCADS